MIRIVILVSLILMVSPAHSEAIIKSFYKKPIMDQQVSVEPGRWAAYRFEAKRAGHIDITASVIGTNGRTASVFVCDKLSFHAFKSGRKSNCRGLFDRNGRLTFSYQAARSGSYFIVADNRGDRYSEKTFRIKVAVPAHFSQKRVSGLRSTFQDLENFIEARFIAPDFDWILKPCGQVNAFSHVQTGDITICTELLLDASKLRSEGQITGILLHELGHSLLNFWGNPNFANEETADAFATYLLMTSGGSEAPRLIEEFAQFWERGNPWAEAENIIESGDTHQISVQRARNIRRNASRGAAFTARWNATIYPHLTDQALRSIINAPGRYGDTTMARQILSSR